MRGFYCAGTEYCFLIAIAIAIAIAIVIESPFPILSAFRDFFLKQDKIHLVFS
jgi:hypothetical protein